MAEILAENCGQPVEKVMADTERDHWMTAEQALEYGLVDHIFKSRDEGLTNKNEKEDK
jgi:ATP-dependent Clp protease protease subunit